MFRVVDIFATLLGFLCASTVQLTPRPEFSGNTARMICPAGRQAQEIDMIRVLLAAACAIAIGTSAPAADLTARPFHKAPPSLATAIYDWSGFYVGANGGWGSSRTCWDAISFGVVAAEGCHDATGGTVGGQIGYRWQNAGWVLGVEAQGNWANFRGSNASQFREFAGGTNRSTVDALGLFTGQVGYSWNNLLWYVKGGGAVTRDEYEGLFTATGVVLDRTTESRWGGVVGTGLEFAFAPNWSFAAEYDHLFMGTRDLNLYGTGARVPAGQISRSGESIRQDVDMVTARINYRFGGPSVAKY
jgi:outer membrane immunogenic protein